MDQLRRVLATIQTQLSALSASQKLLIASLAVIVAMGLFLVGQYAGRSEMMPALTGAMPNELSRAERILKTSGVDARVAGSDLLVPATSHDFAMGRLAENRALPADQSAIQFNNLIEKQSWKNNREQNQQLYTIALQNHLSAWIGEFSTISRANVVLDVPAPNGLGQGSRSPTAAVTVWTSGGGGVPQHTVDAIAGLVAGARAGLTVERVKVIDGSNGLVKKPTNPADAVPSSYLEHATKVEREMRDKLVDFLSYIPGVQVVVSASVDVTRRQTETQRYLSEGQGTINLIKRETGKTETQQQSKRSAEPGVRSNQTADINRSGAGDRFESTDDQSEFNPFPGSTTERVEDPRGMPTHLAVSINVPRGFVAAQIGGAAPADGEEAPEPSQDEIDAKFPEIEQTLRRSVLPHVRTMTAAQGLTDDQIDAQISISMIPLGVGAPIEPSTAGFLGGGSGGSGGMLGLGGGLIDKIVLIGLAVFSMFLMISMVKKASRRIELPSPEELVGIPKALHGFDDMVGEAEEGNVPLEGIEVDDEELNKQLVLGQVTELVQTDPAAAANMMRRWIGTEE